MMDGTPTYRMQIENMPQDQGMGDSEAEDEEKVLDQVEDMGR